MTRVLAIADADSYLKWSAATLDRLPATWERRQLLISSPVTPSAEQARAATEEPVPRFSWWRLRSLLRRDPPDVLLLACTGPTVRALTSLAVARGPERPVLVSGLPGISIPASGRAVELRRDCDLLVVHSVRERAAFTRLAAAGAPGLQVALSHLPFLSGRGAPRARSAGTDVVFAAQAKVPPEARDREAILRGLAQVQPSGSAVVKVRATAGEQQTHHEDHPYPRLWSALVESGQVADAAVRFRAGPMQAALASARCLVTVSSTAALEAIDAGVPVLVLSDFGVDESMINVVFRGSGCLGTLADLRAGRAFRPDPAWLTENYFHHRDQDDLVAVLESLLGDRRSASLPIRPRARPDRAGARGLLRLVVPGSWAGLARRGHRR
ncbi:MAG TPA: DUF6716 putative glycosyltransferase [Microlunatus sp.]|nr:DUF6716 putative glycosyltransferase [Microlunatus sp.]